jgi:hypothetical protein
VIRQSQIVEVGRPMREIGLRGSGTNFVFPSDYYIAGFGFHKSDANSAMSVEFTLNAMVISRSDWEAARESHSYLPQRSSPNVIYGKSDLPSVALTP